MPTYCSPGHPYSSQSIHVTSNPIYKSKDGRYPSDNLAKLTSRPQTVLERISPSSSHSATPRSPRAKTAPPGYKTMPPLDRSKRLITLNFTQMTPWCRDMYRWFTPDPKQGVWHDNRDVDEYRRMALRERLPQQRIYHQDKGLMPSYSGYVPASCDCELLPCNSIFPRNNTHGCRGLKINQHCQPGQKFRYGGTWARETLNANRIGVPRLWESTSLFQDRPIGA